MSTEVILEVKRSFGEPVLLAASDFHSDEFLNTLSRGELVRCDISRPRNPKHHRLAMGLLREVYKNQKLYTVFDDMLDDIKMSLGHFDVYMGMDGAEHQRVKSISFAAMDQAAFNEFYEKMIELILTRILPLADRADLEQRVFEILGERGPNDRR